MWAEGGGHACGSLAEGACGQAVRSWAKCVTRDWAERGRRGVGRGLGFVWVRFWLGFGLSGFWVFFFLLFSFLNLIQSKFEFKFEFEFKPHSNKIMHQHECNKSLNL